MDINTLRSDVRKILARKEMTQEAFARKYDLSSSWFNKFLREEITNPRYQSLLRLQTAIAAEQRK